MKVLKTRWQRTKAENVFAILPSMPLRRVNWIALAPARDCRASVLLYIILQSFHKLRLLTTLFGARIALHRPMALAAFILRGSKCIGALQGLRCLYDWHRWSKTETFKRGHHRGLGFRVAKVPDSHSGEMRVRGDFRINGICW